MKQYQLDEQSSPYQLNVRVLTPAASLTSNVTVHVTAMPGNATGKINNTEMIVAYTDDELVFW